MPGNSFPVSLTNHRRFDLESLEPRLLLSADGFGVGALQNQADDVLAQPQAVLEVAENFETGIPVLTEQDSIFGDFEVDVSLGDDAAGDNGEGQSDAESDTDVNEEGIVEEEPAESANGMIEEAVTASEAVQTFSRELVPSGAGDEAVATGLEGSVNPIPEMLTTTLHNANGPPADQAGIAGGALQPCIPGDGRDAENVQCLM